MSARDLNALPEGFVLDGYRLGEVLGAGGFGITYKAIETLIDRAVALKEYFPRSIATRVGLSVSPTATRDSESFDWGLKRFRREARALIRLRHPNIVAIHRYFEANGTAYLVMAFEDGENLDAHYRRMRLKGFGEAEIRALFLPLLDGAAAAHDAGVLHRDIKPDNIYIRDDGRPVLIDFGAARLEAAERSQSSHAIIAQGYSPPEQYSAGSVQGPYTDIYALGATLYRLIADRRPPPAPDRVHGSAMEPAAELGRGRYSPALLLAIDHALELDPARRPQSIPEWRKKLFPDKGGGDETIPLPGPQAVPPSPPPPRVPAWRIAALMVAASAISVGAYEAVRWPNPQPAPSAELARLQEQLAAARSAAEAAERGRLEAERLAADSEARHKQAEEAARAAVEARSRLEAELKRSDAERQRLEAELAKRPPAQADLAATPSDRAAMAARQAQGRALAARVSAQAARGQALTYAERGRTAAQRARNAEAGFLVRVTDRGTRYEGEDDPGRRDLAYGVFYHRDGDRYEGAFRRGDRHHYGIYFIANGAQIEGQWGDDAQPINAVDRQVDGFVRYEGEWRARRFHGHGVRYWLGASAGQGRYEGEFAEGRPHGHGVFIFNDGRRYEGAVADGKMSGNGVLIDASGRRQAGRWAEDRYVGAD